MLPDYWIFFRDTARQSQFAPLPGSVSVARSEARGNAQRGFLYAAIGVSSWVGAALVERFIGAFFG